jgi:hypothetical protein
LFEEIIHQYGGFAGIIIFPFHIFVQIFNHADDFLEMTITYFIKFLLVLFSLVFFIIFKVIPSKAEEYLLTTYPEYKLENCNIFLLLITYCKTKITKPCLNII